MQQTLLINDGLVQRNDRTLIHLQHANPEDIYRGLAYNYPKFFKMDLLCKWAWIGAEALLKTDSGYLYDGEDPSRIALVLATGNGCLSVDKRYQETLQTIPSPALFVYTLPNIMLGEICIRHGFKGEQLCLVQERFNEQEINFWVSDLLQQRGMQHCLYGWVDATETHCEVQLRWASAEQLKI